MGRSNVFLAQLSPEAVAIWRFWISAGSLLVIKVEDPLYLGSCSMSAACVPLATAHRPLHVCALGMEGPLVSHKLKILCDSVEHFYTFYSGRISGYLV